MINNTRDLLLVISAIADLIVLISANPHVNRPNHSSFVPSVFVAPCSDKISIDLFNRIRVILSNKFLDT